jgi:hypothetical protein
MTKPTKTDQIARNAQRDLDHAQAERIAAAEVLYHEAAAAVEDQLARAICALSGTRAQARTQQARQAAAEHRNMAKIIRQRWSQAR